MFGRVKGTLKVVEAIVIVKRALQALAMPTLPFDPNWLATQLCDHTYKAKPELFDGRLGKPPRAITMAAMALGLGLTDQEGVFGDSARKYMFLALGNVLLDASANASRYGLGAIDAQILRLAEGDYLEHEERTREATTAIVGSLGL